VEKTPEWTREQARQIAIQFLLDKFGRFQGKVVPFYLYREFPNYEPLKPSSRLGEALGIESIESKLIRRKAEQLGLDISDGFFVDETMFDGYVVLLKVTLEFKHGRRFTREDIETLFLEAQMRSVERYELLKRKVQTAQMEEELPLTFSDLYDLYGDSLVYFLHGYCGVGKTTWILEQYEAMSKRKKVIWDEGLAVEPLTDLLIVDSGRFLPASGQITRGEILQTIPLSVEEYTKALQGNKPIAIVDTGDNIGQRVTMAVQAREIRGSSCPIHVELLDAAFLESVVRNLTRERKEYTLQTWQVHEAFNMMCEVFATSWYKRDFSSPQYHRLYQKFYTEQPCVWAMPFGQACKHTAHSPDVLCEQFCKCCSLHCPNKRKMRIN
jgi:hypothetical protein